LTSSSDRVGWFSESLLPRDLSCTLLLVTAGGKSSLLLFRLRLVGGAAGLSLGGSKVVAAQQVAPDPDQD
jgi:hypothetical protein